MTNESVTIKLTEPGDDAELKACSYILSVLEAFTSVQRKRILAYLTDRTEEMQIR